MANFEDTRLAMRELVLKAELFSQSDFEEMMQNHLKFLASGGAGGSWDTFYITNLIFGAYKDADGTDGLQAKLNFRNIQNIDVKGIKLAYSNCCGLLAPHKDWEGADLEGCLFIDSVLHNSSFQNADLYAADFSRSDMKHCDFTRASLVKTDFENCDLTGADFRGAQIDESTSFKNAILIDAKFDEGKSF